MKRFTARPPESVSELCLVRLGLQARGIRGLIYARKVSRAIQREAREAIAANAGLMHSESFLISLGHFGVLQYWRSFAELEAWSHKSPHAEWWREASERMRTRGDFGIYHETYLVPRDRIEAIYANCEPAGLAAFGETGEPVGNDTNSRGRLGRGIRAGSGD